MAGSASDFQLQQEQFEDIFKNHLKIETKSKAIESLFSLRNKAKIDYKPYYQRNYVWDERKASYFIESIILGTEIPPLVFFNSGEAVEVIDGRQRFETVLRFIEDDIKLQASGMAVLKGLKGMRFSTLPDDIKNIFLDSTLRIIEFEIVNEPKLELSLQDKVKKEIFGRYNTGITPLKNFEIDNAVFDRDELSNLFKSTLKKNSTLTQRIKRLFLSERGFKNDPDKKRLVAAEMQFIRDMLVKYRIPVIYYSESTKKVLSEKFYQLIVDSESDYQLVVSKFKLNVDICWEVYSKLNQEKIIHNRIFMQCVVWALYVLENEEIDITPLRSKFVQFISQLYIDSPEKFIEEDYAFREQIVTRYYATLEALATFADKNLDVYKIRSSELKEQLSDNIPDKLKLTELESLRLNKPDPQRTSIEDITRVMTRRKFLLRPSYQRGEAININKATGIIESILLGISLPAIFVFKRLDGVSEVIDGQQRILTMLGFIGSTYIDENGVNTKAKLSNFKLKKPKILTEFINKSFDELPFEFQSKILDFELFVVTIDERINPQFNPIDLFIRLNDKPYPIREHSFEMWNSWAPISFIDNLKSLNTSINEWFYVKSIKKNKYRDRMDNEELLTTLCYFDYTNTGINSSKSIDFFKKETRLNIRARQKSMVTNFLQKAANDSVALDEAQSSLRNIRSFIKVVKLILTNENVPSCEENIYLEQSLNVILNGSKNLKRTHQDMYLIWLAISPISYSMAKEKREFLREALANLINFTKNTPETLDAEQAISAFKKGLIDIHSECKVDKRKLKLSREQKFDLLVKQGNKCALSGTDLFITDDIHVDHIIPISKGGKDIIDNLQLVHSDENLSKGAS